MDKLSDIKEIKALLSKHGFSFSKALGQNFIAVPELCPKMAEAAVPDKDCGILEIGPGIGVLTRELAKRAKKVVSIEIDKRLLPILEESLCDLDNIKIINADVLKTDLKKLAADEFPGMRISVCANLPYYLSSPLIMQLLESGLPFESATLMLQEETAERLCSKVGSRKAGAVTAAVNFYAQVEELFYVPASSFYPMPKVNSKVLKLVPRSDGRHGIEDERDYFRFLKAAFSLRRKCLLNSLSAAAGISKQELLPILNELKLSEKARIENLSESELAALYLKLKK